MSRKSPVRAQLLAWSRAVAAAVLVGIVATTMGTTSAPAAANGCAVDLADVMAWWRGENQTTAVVGPQLVGAPAYTDAVAGRGFSLGPARAAAASGVRPATDGVTVAAWVRIARPAPAQALVSRWRFTGGGDGDRAFALLVVDDALTWLTDEQTLRRPLELRVRAPGLLDGRFHHVAATRGQDLAVLYLDGKPIGSAPSLGGTLNPATDVPLRLGGGDGVPHYLTGAVDEPTIFDRALTAAEVAAIVSAGSSGLCSSGTTSIPGFAGPGTVGHLADLPGYNTPATNLVVHQGDAVTTRDGQVVEGMHITGRLYVRHRNVVVRHNRIGMGVFAVPTSTTPVSALVAWNTIGPEYGHEASSKSDFLPGNGRGENIVFYRNEIFGGIDLFNFYNTRGNVTIAENWIYGAYQMLNDPYQQAGASTLSHSDGIQVHWGGTKYHVLRNRFDLFLFRGYYWSGQPNNGAQVQYSPRVTAKANLGKAPNIGPMTTGFLLQQTNGPLDDIVFDGNRIDGDYYRLWSFPKNSYAQSATNVRITNNTIVRRYRNFGRHQLIGADTPGNIVFTGNTDQNGAPIPTPTGMRTS